MSRFVLLNAQLLPVADAGGEPAAELDTQQNLIIALPNAEFEQLHTFEKAQKMCADLRLGGHDDWRLPTDLEAQACIARSIYNPATKSQAFGSTKNDWCWTSTPCAWRPGSAAWCVSFDFGFVSFSAHGYECFVRAVRVASPAAGQ
jgi:hypothetical protein